MAIVKNASKSVEVANGETLLNACDELGIDLGCRAGVCKICEIEVLEGMDNLSELSMRENEASLLPKKRLACQAVINGGEIEINH